jgi:hypothetical protein
MYFDEEKPLAPNELSKSIDEALPSPMETTEFFQIATGTKKAEKYVYYVKEVPEPLLEDIQPWNQFHIKQNISQEMLNAGTFLEERPMKPSCNIWIGGPSGMFHLNL